MLLATGRALAMPANEQLMNDGWPPAHYRLEDARVVVDVRPTHGLPRQTLTLVGGGQSLYANGQGALRVPFAADELLVVVNELYRMRFFDLPAYILPVKEVFLGHDGYVDTQARRLHDSPTTSVCFALPLFEKCVAYEADLPAELEQLTRRLLALARQRTKPVPK